MRGLGWKRSGTAGLAAALVVIGLPALSLAATSYKVSLTPTPSTVEVGKPFGLLGVVSPGAAGATVQVQRFDGHTWRPYVSPKLDSRSHFNRAVTAPSTPGTMRLRAFKAAASGTAAAYSASVLVRVVTQHYSVTASAPGSIALGAPFTVTGKMSPTSSGSSVVLQHKVGGNWLPVTHAASSATGTYTLSTTPASTQSQSYRVYKAASGTLAQGLSAVMSPVVNGPDTTPPGQVSDLSEALTTQTSVTLSWAAPNDSDLSGFQVRRLAGTTAPATPTEGDLVAELPQDADSVNDDKLVSGSAYSYAVFAHDSRPNYADPATITVTTTSTDPAVVARSITVTSGSAADLDLSPDLVRVTSFTRGSDDASDLSLLASQAGGLAVTALSSAAEQAKTIQVTGEGCSTEVRCDVPFTLSLDIAVQSLATAAPVLEGVTEPSGDRLAQATSDGGDVKALDDEVLLTLGTPTQPGTLTQAQALASQVNAHVTGSFEDLGVYELRWDTAPDLDAALAQLNAADGVASATRSVFTSGDEQALPPGDWADDGHAVTWPFDQIRAQQAWDVTDGSDVKVGIVDGGTVYDHDDLDVTQTLGGDAPQTHATHVAGLACAVANGKGVVGVSWGCPVVSSGTGSNKTYPAFFKTALSAARDVAEQGVRVINMSLGINDHSPDFCVSQAGSDADNAYVQKYAAPFRALFNGPVGRDIVWTLSAGNNCGEGVHSPWGASWALPNVVTVAASNSDKTLASFSNFGPGVEVAAPGGVDTTVSGSEGLWSTSFKACGLLGKGRCPTYEQMAGTSMASPVVAGVAALAFSAAPDARAADIGSCITSTAGITTGRAASRSSLPAMGAGLPITPKISYAQPGADTSWQLPIVDAAATVQCALSGVTHADVLIAGQGDRTSSGNGTDLGDLTAELESVGYDVVTDSSLPDKLSGFKEIWYVDTVAMTADEQDRVASYVASGGSLYLTGERPCCSVSDSSIALINRLVPSVTVAYGGEDTDSVTILSSAPYGLASTPRSVSELVTSVPGSLTGVQTSNIVGYASSPDNAVVAAWGPESVTGGGKIAVVMDINWVAEQYRGSHWNLFAENLAAFLR